MKKNQRNTNNSVKIKMINKVLIFSFVFLGLSSCSDFLSNDLPGNEVTFENGIKTESDLQELLNSTYDVLANSFAGNAQKFAEVLGADVFIDGNLGNLLQVYNRSSDFFNGDVGGFYKQPYIVIYRANTILDEIDRVDVSGASKDRIIGEAKAMRALSHLELVKIFAQPYGFTADNSHPGIVLRQSTIADPAPRNTVGEVYASILQDLNEALEQIPTDNGIYLDKDDVRAILARVYFYQNNFVKAAEFSEAIINNSSLILSDTITSRYVQNQVPSEALFYIISRGLEDNRSGQFRGPFASDLQNPVIKANPETIALINEFPEDKRIANFDTIEDGGSLRFVYTKYNSLYFNVTLLSLSEQLLIASESLAELNTRTSDAVSYLNRIKSVAGVPTLDEGTIASIIISESRKERRKEFAGEGINLFDLKRIGAKGEIVEIRGAPWDCPGMVLQFPASEITVKGFVLNEEGGCN